MLSNRLSYFIPCQSGACACFRLMLYSQHGLLRSERSVLHHNIHHHNRLSLGVGVVGGFIQGFSDPRSDIHDHHTHLRYHGSSFRADSRHTVYQRCISQDCRSADLHVAELPGADRSLLMKIAQGLTYILSQTSNGVKQVIKCFT